jgi:uncharacterized protein (AIM24 family)
MVIPVLMPAAARAATFDGLAYHIEGDLVPVLHLELKGASVFFDHYVLLWKDPAVHVELKPQTKHLRRSRSGAPVFLTEAAGPGHIAMGRNGAGRTFAMTLQPGETLDVHEHQFIAATGGVEYSNNKLKGPATILFGGTSFMIESFTCQQQPGMIWMHGYGDVFEVTLQQGEQIDVEPGGWIFKEHSVQLEPVNQRLATAILAGEQIAWHRFSGPGRVGLQSMYLHQTVDIQNILQSARYE